MAHSRNPPPSLPLLLVSFIQSGKIQKKMFLLFNNFYGSNRMFQWFSWISQSLYWTKVSITNYQYLYWKGFDKRVLQFGHPRNSHLRPIFGLPMNDLNQNTNHIFSLKYFSNLWYQSIAVYLSYRPDVCLLFQND